MNNILWLLLGAVFGILSMLSQWWTVNRLHPLAPPNTVAWIVGGAALRWVLVAGLLFAALQHGIVPALWAFTGLWLARTVVLVWMDMRN